MYIALIDDQQLFIKSLAYLLEKYDFIEKISTFKNPRVFFDQGMNPDPDIIIADILMPELSGFEMIQEFKKRNINFKIIILSSIVEIKIVRHMIRSGACGYLGKDSSPEELIEAIKTVHEGEPYVGESLRKKLVRNTLMEDRFIYNLSPREKEVLQYVCSGHTIKETAHALGLSTNTVQTYYKNVLKKFNLNRTADLIIFAVKNGLYNPKKK